MTVRSSDRLYDHPFSREYWKDAAAEFRNVRTLVFAALMIALRVVFKAVKIPIGPYLDINTAFLVNALGAMTFGPVVAIAAAAITDTLGAVLFPSGPYFFPFIFVEIAGSLIFSLFLYRTRVTVLRVVLSRFCISFFVNLVLQTPIMILYYNMYLGGGYAWIDLPRIIKNLVLFPFEALVLVFFLRYAMPPLERMRLLKSRSAGLMLNRKEVIRIVALALASAAVFAGGSIYLHNSVSLSASYTPAQRLEANRSCLSHVLEEDPALFEKDTAAIVESAYSPFLSGETSWTVAVYKMDLEVLAGEDKTVDTVMGYSKSKAAKDPALTRLYTAEMKTGGDGTLISFEKRENTGK